MEIVVKICDIVGTICLIYVIFMFVKVGLPIIKKEIFKK
jgi:hypothetical protein